MAFIAETFPDIFVGVKGKTSFGTYEFTEATTVGFIPISPGVTVFSVQLQGTNPAIIVPATVLSDFPVAAQDTIEIQGFLLDTGTYRIEYI